MDVTPASVPSVDAVIVTFENIAYVMAKAADSSRKEKQGKIRFEQGAFCDVPY
jgi:hypothetical protein